MKRPVLRIPKRNGIGSEGRCSLWAVLYSTAMSIVRRNQRARPNLKTLPMAMKTGERKRTLKGFHGKPDKWGDGAKEISGEPMETDGFTQERAIEEGIDLAGELHCDLGG